MMSFTALIILLILSHLFTPHPLLIFSKHHHESLQAFLKAD